MVAIERLTRILEQRTPCPDQGIPAPKDQRISTIASSSVRTDGTHLRSQRLGQKVEQIDAWRNLLKQRLQIHGSQLVAQSSRWKEART